MPLITIAAFFLTGIGFLFAMFYWLVSRTDKISDQLTSIKDNHLVHIYEKLAMVEQWMKDRDTTNAKRSHTALSRRSKSISPSNSA